MTCHCDSPAGFFNVNELAMAALLPVKDPAFVMQAIQNITYFHLENGLSKC
jgi:hypothetical protein